MNYKNIAILLILVAAASAAITRYYFPKVETKTQEITKEVVRNDIRTVVREVTKSDGTKEVITETTDKSIKSDSSNKTAIVNSKAQWLLSLSANRTLKDPELGYELSVAKRQLGPFYLVGTVGYRKADLSAGLGLGMEF